MMRALFAISCCAALAQQPQRSFDSVSEGNIIHGFQVRSVYLDDAERPMGGRFVHIRTGFTLDLLRIQSVPQGFIWVTSYPTSNMGEPHTQEHLLLGKGNKGRAVASLEPMSLAVSSAFTMQWRTCYDFYTSAGPEVFYQQFERRMDALLNPDYTDEEIRREVRNFGIVEDPAGGLRIEEKGSVYNEMVSSMDQPARRLFRALSVAVYGPEHPMSFSAGGLPEALRAIRPEHIRTFHAANYHLANMGMIGSFPKEMALVPMLARFDLLLNRLQAEGARTPVQGEAELPPPQPAPAGEIRIVDYPHKNEQQPGMVWFGWPADRTLDTTAQLLLRLFLENVAGDPTTNLYKRFIDSRTRELDLGAKGVSAMVLNNPGNPVVVAFRDIAAAHINEREVADLRRRVHEELQRIAAWPDGSPELLQFNDRLRSRVLETRRELAKFVNSPPGFGFRGTGAQWLEHLDDLAASGAFRKSVTMKSDLAAIEKRLAGGRNFWRESLKNWKLLEAEPYGVASRANPALIRQAQLERQARVRAEIDRLKARYGVTDEQQALRRYRADYDAATAEIEKAAARVTAPKFVDNPPLGLDTQLDYRTSTLARGIPLVSSRFDGITSATTGIALRLDGVPERRLLYLSALPALLTRVGVIENGRPVAFEEMTGRLRNEVLELTAYVSTNYRTGRAEVAVRGAGNDGAEARKALGWMELVLYHPDWRPENLPRIRDVVDQALSALRNTTQGSEENWVHGPAAAWRRQDNPVLLAADCFLTRAHNVHRLRWMLKDGTAETRAAVAAWLEEAARLTGSRAERTAALAARVADLPADARAMGADAARDLEQMVNDIPDASLAADWSDLCLQMRRDLLLTPARALAELDAVRRSLLKTGNARLFLITSPALERELSPLIAQVTAGLAEAPAGKPSYKPTRRIEARLRARRPDAVRPVFVGLLNPNTQGGVFLNSAPGASYLDTDREKLLDYLAANQYSGHGAHGIFMKTWGAGLAYSNGLRPSASAARLNYYAERTPELPQTLRFVIGELKKARQDPGLAEYAVAQTFGEIRAASRYEARGEAMAADLADGFTPEVVARFLKSVLALRRSPELSRELHERMLRVYGRVLPGLEPAAGEAADGVNFVIGPERQFAAYEQYLKSVRGPEARLYRLYPRDFWLE